MSCLCFCKNRENATFFRWNWKKQDQHVFEFVVVGATVGGVGTIVCDRLWCFRDNITVAVSVVKLA